MENADHSQLYTPAMLAELLGVSVRTVRRWHRAGFITPASEVMQLPYFDYEGLSTARQLATWMQQGASVQSIQTQLEALRARAGAGEALQQLPIVAEGKRLILRQGDQYFEASGQLRFGFEATSHVEDSEPPAIIQFQPHLAARAPSREPSLLGELTLAQMIDEATAAEDEADFDSAVEWYRSALASHGPDADICFQIAELLYRAGDVHGARERYFVALELNPEMVEARANLGCVLAECGQLDLAIAAFEGALAQYPDYADVHFHLARVLDDANEVGKAVEHWQRFIELAPASPWAEEAQHRLSQIAPFLDF